MGGMGRAPVKPPVRKRRNSATLLTPQSVDHRLSYVQQEKLQKDLAGGKPSPRGGGAYDDDSDDNEEDEDPEPWFLLHVDSVMRRNWDLMVILLVVWGMFIIPLQAAFWSMDDYTVTWAVVEHSIDALFMIDIFINFR